MCSLLIYDVNFVLLTSPHHAIASTSKLAWGGFWQYLKLMNAQNLCGRVGVLSADKHLQQVTEGSLFLWKILETTKEALSRVWARQMQLILMCLTQILFRVASILLPTEHAKYYYSYEQTTSYFFCPARSKSKFSLLLHSRIWGLQVLQGYQTAPGCGTSSNNSER